MIDLTMELQLIKVRSDLDNFNTELSKKLNQKKN